MQEFHRNVQSEIPTRRRVLCWEHHKPSTLNLNPKPQKSGSRLMGCFLVELKLIYTRFRFRVYGSHPVAMYVGGGGNTKGSLSLYKYIYIQIKTIM